MAGTHRRCGVRSLGGCDVALLCRVAHHRGLGVCSARLRPVRRCPAGQWCSVAARRWGSISLAGCDALIATVGAHACAPALSAESWSMACPRDRGGISERCRRASAFCDSDFNCHARIARHSNCLGVTEHRLRTKRCRCCAGRSPRFHLGHAIGSSVGDPCMGLQRCRIRTGVCRRAVCVGRRRTRCTCHRAATIVHGCAPCSCG